jgi:hypothetical protein
MGKVKIHCGRPMDVDIDTDRCVDVFIDCFDKSPVPIGDIRIVIIEDPFNFDLPRLVYEYPDAYTHLLTFHEHILETIPKAEKFLCMNIWVKGYESINKHFAVSTVVGGKNHPMMSGYALRHELWRNRERITIPREFYLSGNAPYSHIFVPWSGADYTGQLVLGVSKEPLFDSQFHIAIENTPIKNYFSEKILDCFQSRTIPIYCGCTNIEDYFNGDGIIIARSVDEIISECNKLTPDTYDSMGFAMEDNFIRSCAWLDHNGQIENVITKILST